MPGRRYALVPIEKLFTLYKDVGEEVSNDEL